MTDTTDKKTTETPGPESIPLGAPGNAQGQAAWAQSEAGKAYAAQHDEREAAYKAEAEAAAAERMASVPEPMPTSFAEQANDDSEAEAPKDAPKPASTKQADTKTSGSDTKGTSKS